MTHTLREIIEENIKDFYNKQPLPFVVKESVPIIWFGDIEKYFNSPQKVITVAINPSLNEFKENRFFAALRNLSVESLYDSLNDYFYYNPYKKWFYRYEKVINCVGASYGGKVARMYAKNTALNIDLFTPVATDPTWGDLTKHQKDQITNSSLFWKLYNYLDPDIVFISLSKKVVEEQFELTKKEKISSSANDGKIEIYKDGKKKIIYGHNMRGTVFGGLGMNVDFINQVIKDSVGI